MTGPVRLGGMTIEETETGNVRLTDYAGATITIERADLLDVAAVVGAIHIANTARPAD